MRYSRQAREDILYIWQHIATSDLHSADRVLDRIEARCEQLKEFPRLGPRRPDVFAGARALVIERWLALYRIDEYGPRIVRIVDGAQDPSAIAIAPDEDTDDQ
jgi:toxin ParE1/3/4